MNGKVLAVLVFAAVVTRGQAVTEIRLEDETRHHISNPLIGFSISIAKSFLDSLVSCNVIFPNGVMYEAWPNDNIPEPTVSSGQAVEPFNSCGIEFRNPPASLSGTYELLSHVRHSADQSETLIRQRTHVTFTPSELRPANVDTPVNPKFKFEKGQM